MKKPRSYLRGFVSTDGEELLGLRRAVLAAVLGLLARAGGEREHEREQILEHVRLLGEGGRKCPLLGVRIALPPTSGKVLHEWERTHV